MKRRQGDRSIEHIQRIEEFVDVLVGSLDLPDEDQEFIIQDRRLKGAFGLVAVKKIQLEQDLKIAEERLAGAYVDQVTGLMNRILFYERIKKLDSKSSYLVACMDLRGLKRINDTPGLGHPAGDKLLATSARTLEQSLRSDSIIARMGEKGDEFGVVLPYDNEDDIEAIKDRLRHNFGGKGIGMPCQLNKSTAVHLSARFGFRTVDGSRGETIIDALHAADEELTKLTDAEASRGTERSVAFVQ